MCEIHRKGRRLSCVSTSFMRQIDNHVPPPPPPLYTWLGNVMFLHHHMHVIWRHLPQTATDRVDELRALSGFQLPSKNKERGKENRLYFLLGALRKAQVSVCPVA